MDRNKMEEKAKKYVESVFGETCNMTPIRECHKKVLLDYECGYSAGYADAEQLVKDKVKECDEIKAQAFPLIGKNAELEQRVKVLEGAIVKATRHCMGDPCPICAQLKAPPKVVQP